MKRAILFTAIIGVMLLMSCAPTLPKETVELSMLLDKQIDALEKNHIAMVNLYFQEKKIQAKTVVDDELYPAWLDVFFAKDVVKKEWGSVAENVIFPLKRF